MYTQSAPGSILFCQFLADYARRSSVTTNLFSLNDIAVNNCRAFRRPHGIRRRPFPPLPARSDQPRLELTDRGLAPWRSVGIAQQPAPVPIHLAKKTARLGTTFGPCT